MELLKILAEICGIVSVFAVLAVVFNHYFVENMRLKRKNRKKKGDFK